MKPYILESTPVRDELLNLIIHLPTTSIGGVVDPAFFQNLSDRDFMSMATLLARKGHLEGGCPIGAVVVDNETRRILGKGHNTLVQENNPYNHGETAAMRDAGRIDFTRTTLFTSLSPCDICASLLHMRRVARVVVGDVTNASGNEEKLRAKGVTVDILEDPIAIALYAEYRTKHPDLDREDWMGLG